MYTLMLPLLLSLRPSCVPACRHLRRHQSLLQSHLQCLPWCPPRQLGHMAVRLQLKPQQRWRALETQMVWGTLQHCALTCAHDACMTRSCSQQGIQSICKLHPASLPWGGSVLGMQQRAMQLCNLDCVPLQCPGGPLVHLHGVAPGPA